MKKKKVGKSVFSILMVMAMVMGTLCFGLDSTAYAANGEISIDLSKEFQQIRGFGGMNIPEWVGSDLSASQRQTVFGNGEGELGFDVLRIFVNEDPNQWSKAVPTAKAAYDKGAIVFASPLNPPADMVEQFNSAGRQGKRLKHDKYAAYAQHLNNFVKYMADNGVKLYAISVQNEPDYAYEWTWWSEDECLDFMKNYAGSINCRVISPESFQYRKNMYDKILNDNKALENMDIMATHFYGTQYKDFAYPLFQQKGAGKELWMTEVYYPNSDKDSNENWDQALSLSQHISNSLTDANMQAYVWWYIRRCYGPLNENGTISKRGYVMAQFSKYIRNNYVRVEATKKPTNEVFVSAYKGDGNKVTVVAINTGNNEFKSSCSVNQSTIKGVDCRRTSGSESLAKVSGTQFSDKSFTVSIPAKSVATYVLTMDSKVADEGSSSDNQSSNNTTDTNSDNQNSSNTADTDSNSQNSDNATDTNSGNQNNVVDNNSGNQNNVTDNNSNNQNNVVDNSSQDQNTGTNNNNTADPNDENDFVPATADKSNIEIVMLILIIVLAGGVVVWYKSKSKLRNKF